MPDIAFAKPAFDLGMATNLLEEHCGFWGETVGLDYDHLAKLGGGFHQHRWRHGHSILKVNHTRAPLASAEPGGYRAITLTTGGAAKLETPDGVPVWLVAEDAAALILHAVTADLDRFNRFHGELLGLTPDGTDAFRLGDCRILATAGDPPAREHWRARGLRYMTLQIFDCDAVTARLERAGAEVARAPMTLGQVRYSFIRDPDGNWIELSERESLTGKPVPR